MRILLRKKIIYYILGIVAIIAICMLGSLKIINGVEFSVWTGIWKLPKEVLNTCTIQNAFDAGVSGWIYILMPLIVSIPSASCIMDEIQSKFYLYIEGRKGKGKYVYSRFFRNIVSAGSISFLGIGIYTLIIVLIFPINPIYTEVETVGLMEMSVHMLIGYVFVKFIYILLYSIAISLFASLLVLIYQNLYFDLSIVFILNYIFKDFFMKNKILYPVVIIAVMFILYHIVWKIRGEKN